MIIVHILFSIIGAAFIYFGIDTVLYAGRNLFPIGAAYAVGGVALIWYMAADACDHYGWGR